MVFGPPLLPRPKAKLNVQKAKLNGQNTGSEILTTCCVVYTKERLENNEAIVNFP
jgi:hypothetical protein